MRKWLSLLVGQAFPLNYSWEKREERKLPWNILLSKLFSFSAVGPDSNHLLAADMQVRVYHLILGDSNTSPCDTAFWQIFSRFLSISAKYFGPCGEKWWQWVTYLFRKGFWEEKRGCLCLFLLVDSLFPEVAWEQAQSAQDWPSLALYNHGREHGAFSCWLPLCMDTSSAVALKAGFADT